LTIAAGDTIRFEMFGYVRNNTGATQTIRLAIGVGSLDLEVAGSATVATATDTPVFVRGYIGVVSSGQTYVSAEASMNPVAGAGATATGIRRNAWQQSTSDFTGAHTVRIAGRGSTSASGLLLRVAGYSIQKMQG
jgi:hypothetical protein